ncbi:MAG: BatA domain-containing protein [Planctomycetaceae bacterium]
MTLINAPLIFGLVLAGIPVVLHLIMRARPKKLEFPALRLLKARQTSNSRRMRLRHLLLLLLRIVVIAVAVLALTRPSLPPARYGLRPWEWAALAVVIGGSVGFYYWRSGQLASTSAASHVVRDQRGRLRTYSVLGGLLAALLLVGVPWGFRVQAEMTSPREDTAEDIPVAAVFLFDVSESMSYRHENLTRLEHAQQTAAAQLSVLPTGSLAAIVSNAGDDEVVFQADLAGTQSRIESLETRSVTGSLNSMIKRAIEAHVDDRRRVQQDLGSTAGGSDLFSREIYVLTDLSVTAWQQPDESGLRDLLVQHDWLQIYLVDVSVEQPVNVSLSSLRLSEESTVVGRDVFASVTVSATPFAAREAIVEAFTINSEGREIPIGAPSIVNFTGTPPQVTFRVPASADGSFQQGVIRTSTSDPLAADDIRYFTFGTRPRPDLLFVSDNTDESKYLKNALQPEELKRVGVLYYNITEVSTAQFARHTLPNFDAVVLINCRRPDPSLWSSLTSYVRSGGALFVVAGGGTSALDPARWRTPATDELLPGLPVTPITIRGDTGQLRIVENQHPIGRGILQYPEDQTALYLTPFYKCWTLDLTPDAQTLMILKAQIDYPVLIERRVGEGRVLMFASAVDYLTNGGQEWTDLPAEWVFVPFAEQIVQYLTGGSDQRHNFTVGTPVDISVPAAQRFSKYLVARPRLRQSGGTLSPEDTSLLITDADEPGQYQVRDTDDGVSFESAFSMNMIDAESDLTIMEDEALTEILGKDRYARVRDPEELQRAVRVGRLGVEVFPVLIGLLLLLFCAEHLMANFFYDGEPAPEESPAAAAAG